MFFTEKFQEQPKRIIFPVFKNRFHERMNESRDAGELKGRKGMAKRFDSLVKQVTNSFENFIQLGFLISGSFEIKITENSVEFASFHDHKQAGPFDQM